MLEGNGKHIETVSGKGNRLIDQIDPSAANKKDLQEAIREYQSAGDDASDKTAVKVAVITAITTVLLSMVFNASALTAGKQVGSFWWTVGLFVGLSIPLWILALTYAGQHIAKTNANLAYACYTLTGIALVVSLPHLVAGYQALGLGLWLEAIPLALVTDLLQVLMKLVIIHLVKRGE